MSPAKSKKEEAKAPRALEGLKVVEYGRSMAAPYCTKLLACYGAEVIKIEPPEGDETRDYGPFVNDKPSQEGSGLFLYLNTDKLGITLDLTKPKGREVLFKLLQDTDVFVDDLLPREADDLGLDYPSLEKINKRLINVSITAFGRTGPYSNYKAYDLGCSAATGMAVATGNPDQEPLALPLSQPEYVGGIAGAGATMTAIRARDHVVGEGQHVDVSIVDVLSTLFHAGGVISLYIYQGVSGVRRGSHAGFFHYPSGTLPCKDGYIAMSAPQVGQWIRFVQVMGEPEWTKNPRYRDRRAMGAEYPDEVDALVTPWLMQHTKKEMIDICLENRIPFGPIWTVEDLLESPHLEERKFFAEVEHPEAGKFKYPGQACELSETPAIIRRPAPLLGQHNKDILCGRLGYSPQDLDKLRAEGVIASFSSKRR